MQRPAIALSLTICIMLALSLSAQAAEVQVPREAQLAVNAAQALLDQQLGSVQAALTVIATTGEVQSLEWDAMQPLLAKLQEHVAPCAIWYVTPDGTYYTADTGLMEQTLADRDYFAPLMAGQTVQGEVVVSKSTGQLSAIVAVPVYQGGQVIGSLGASVFAGNMAEWLAASLDLPEGMSLLVLDAAGQTVCAIPADGVQWAEASKSAVFADATGTVQVNTLDQQPVLLVYKVSETTGWRYLIGLQ